jgi:hypothetical protein
MSAWWAGFVTGDTGAYRHSVTDSSVRGFRVARRPQVFGSVIGAIGASVFMLGSRGAMTEPWPIATLVLWLVAILAYVWAVFARPRTFAVSQGPRPRAGLIYVASVVGMLVTIAGGSAILRGLGHGNIVVALVAIAVGLHFLPFASAFRAPVFTVLGTVVAGIGLAGVVIGWFAPAAAVVAAVIAGLSMLVIMIADAVGGFHVKPGGNGP